MKVSSEQKREAIVFFCYLLLIGIDTVVFGIVWNSYYNARLFSVNSAIITGLFLITYTSLARLYSGFDIKMQRIQELVYSHIITSFMTGTLIYLVTWVIEKEMPNMLPIFGCICFWSVVSVLWAYWTVRLMKRIIVPGRALAVYDNLIAYKNGIRMSSKLDWRFSLEKEISIGEGLARIFDELDSGLYNFVFLLGVASSERNDIIKYCISNDIEVCVRPNIGDFLIQSGHIAQIDHLPVMFLGRGKSGVFYLGLKRFLDIFFSFLALFVLSPVLLLTALAIKLEDGGVIFYKQDRYTINGKVFSIYKFRSMKENADNGGTEGIITLQNDARITRVGRVIRRCRIDELPQLLNILKGDMSIVGPRPERIEAADIYQKDIPEFKLRLQVKAGLTGYAQVYGKANSDPYDKLQMDLYYIGQQSIVTDMKIVLATIKIVFMPESTEGFTTGIEIESQEDGE